MSAAPEIRPRRPGEPGSVAGDLARGAGRAASLFPEDSLSAAGTGRRTGEARLHADAFGTTTSDARTRLERILDGEGVLVSTGQQPVLFLGPLYVLYKALGAIQLAEEIERATGRPALASFWVASDDHDWGEVGRTRLLDPENHLRSIELETPPGGEGRPAGEVPLPEAIEGRLDELSQLLPNSEFVEDYLDLFRDAYEPGRTLGRAFGTALAGVLGPRPLAWLDAGRHEVKEAAAPLLLRALEDAEGAEAAERRGGERVRSAGYELQVPFLEGATRLFCDADGRRRRIHRAEGGGFRLGRDGPRAEAAELRRRLEREPGRFSPNVSLRPVVESWLLPVGCAVLGPAELAYWAQLPPLFERHGVEMPAVRPRPSWIVVEEKVGKVLEKLDVGPEAFREGGEELIRRVVSGARPGGVDGALRDLRRVLDAAVGDVRAAVERELPGIRSSVGKARGELFAAVDGLERAVDGRVEERQEVLVRQIRKAAVHLYPDGSPQERVLNPLYYLARYGRHFAAAVEAAGRERPLRPGPGTDG